ncbi:hypothetical protein TBLA_0A07420 [Henningerozyma blattae CBS 6284]|uniref:Pantothenate kinase n=1 Tax=Henningerozyma blattae (strain ATCC 34711 / CBS 6284 / DSM 70876 / NBRC 10599 / NRRL Y-10934 / UCD 77-7) TaxID=1071380 RepID=I2GWN0_HENB6|nr:hypothetical protein TBLA_0A07420 [Tetrapisispora blattae CBS 6284]CCH58532.1 hypothetical protein TBLA_0A07420 [Tetrapisispora blattae CBS 6284]
MSMQKPIDYRLDYSNDTFNLAIDIGGTLSKVVYSPINSNQLFFQNCETEKIDEFITMLHKIICDSNGNNYKNVQIFATGGGSHKFEAKLKSEFKDCLKYVKLDEMECLIKGLDFFISNESSLDGEIFTYNDTDGIVPRNTPTTYPYMLVNIGSGVSILKIDSPTSSSRIGGSSLGGGTLWGLLSLITGAKTYDQMLDWAQNGDNTNIDMLVSDIYGTDTGYDKIGLKSTAIASSFAKCFQNRSPNAMNQSKDQVFRNEDISKSLLFAISNNIGQIAYLQAKIHNVSNIYFGGSYTRGHLITMNTLSYAIDFWSNSTKMAFFLKHEGFLGAMGAFLHSTSPLSQ